MGVAARKFEAAVPGRRCVPVRMDVVKPKDVDAAVDQALRQFPRIDILVNGAAGNFLCPAEQISANAYKRVFEIDAIGTFLVTQAVYKKTMKKTGGSIINVTATLHWNGELFQTHAGSAKAAIEGMTRHLANEWGKDGVRMNNVAPGPIEDTEGYRRLGGFMPHNIKDQFIRRIPMQRNGKSHDISEACLYLASSASTYVTGTTICADGGAWMTTGGFVYHAMNELKSKI